MDPFTDVSFSPAPCLPCCVTPVTGCSCALLISPFLPPYADYATAVAAIADQTNGCIAYYEFTGDTNNTLTASFNGTTFSLAATSDASSPPPAISISMWSSLSLLAAANLSIAFAITTDGGAQSATAELYSCSDGSLIDSDTSSSASGTLVVTAPSDGEYFLKVISNTTSGAGTNHFSSSITSSSAYWVNPVIALWDDSGTTRKLWACPKLLLPLLTEATGTWYASCADAAAVLTDPLQVSNCVGFTAQGDILIFTATDGGSSLTLAITLNNPDSGLRSSCGGINLVAGQTVSVSISQDGGAGGTPAYGAVLYDDTGTMVEDFGGTSNPLTSSAVPYTGRYTIAVALVNPPPAAALTTASFVITSSGTLSVNPVQARYDLALTCAGLLDCGDTCP